MASLLLTNFTNNLILLIYEISEENAEMPSQLWFDVAKNAGIKNENNFSSFGAFLFFIFSLWLKSSKVSFSKGVFYLIVHNY